MEFLKKLWNWLLSQTTINEQVEAKVAEVKKELTDVKIAANNVIKQSKDVVNTVKSKKRKNYKPKGSGTTTQPKGSGTTTQPKGSGTTSQPKGSGTTTQPKGSGVTTQPKGSGVTPQLKKE